MLQIPFALRWTVPENELKHSNDSFVKHLFSKSAYYIPNLEYYLKICPNGHKENTRGQTWIFLNLEFENFEKIEADYIITIESANYSRNCYYVYEESIGQGYFTCNTEDFFDPKNKFFVYGKLDIKVTGVFKFEDDSILMQKWNGAKLGNELWENDDTKDFTIVVDEKEINVHKLILGTRSDVFRAMFDSTFKESIENKVEITDFSFEIVQTAIKLIYDCHFVTSLTVDSLLLLLQFFDKYNLPKLKDEIESHLIDQISPSTVCRLINHSIITNSTKLKEKCMEHLTAYFTAKTPLSDIDKLDKDVALKILTDSLYQQV